MRPHTITGARRRSELVIPAADTKTSRSTRFGNWIAVSAATKPPIELPTSTTSPRPSCSQS